MLVPRRIDATNFHCNVRKDIPKNVLTSNLNEKNVRSATQEAIGLRSLLDSECKSLHPSIQLVQFAEFTGVTRKSHLQL